MKQGYFITLEGIEGAGKTTAVQVLADCLHNFGVPFILTREPGGTEIAEAIRKVILSNYQETMHPDTEMLLYFAGRAQHLNQVIIPALQRGEWVICDRFTDATYAYQGGGRGLSLTKISVLEQWVQGDLRPDYTLLFDVPVSVGLARIKKERYPDRIESENELFFEKVRTYYLERARQEPQRFYIINAENSRVEIARQLTEILRQLITSN